MTKDIPWEIRLTHGYIRRLAYEKLLNATWQPGECEIFNVKLYSTKQAWLDEVKSLELGGTNIPPRPFIK